VLFGFGHKDCSCERGYFSSLFFRVERRLPRCGIAGVSLHRVQVQSQTLQPTIGESHGRIRCVEDHHDVFVDSVVPAIRIQLQYDQPGVWLGPVFKKVRFR
jgi:hypothetical protein